MGVPDFLTATKFPGRAWFALNFLQALQFSVELLYVFFLRFALEAHR